MLEWFVVHGLKDWWQVTGVSSVFQNIDLAVGLKEIVRYNHGPQSCTMMS